MIGDVRNQRRKINNIPPSSIYGELHNQLNVESSNPSFFSFFLSIISLFPLLGFLFFSYFCEGTFLQKRKSLDWNMESPRKKRERKETKRKKISILTFSCHFHNVRAI